MNQTSKRQNPVTIIHLAQAIYNTFPTRRHKSALANMRANLAEAVYRASKPKRSVRL